MKNFFLAIVGLLFIISISGMTAFADEASITVYVTIADANGNLALSQTAVTVTDIDGDNALTINDALYVAHEENYTGGAAAGYASGTSDYGFSLNKLWGTTNGGSYGYYINNTSAWNLTDPLKNGDYLNAYVYTDLITWSDTYCYFDVNTATVSENGTLTLTLNMAGYDANYTPITLPVKGATIMINGTATTYKTDINGNVTIKPNKAGEYIISAVSDTQTLVPPVCIVTATADAAQTGDAAAVHLLIVTVCLTALAFVVIKHKRSA